VDKSQYHLWDWHRILFGNAPVEFLAETLLRTVIVYIFLLAVVTWLGKRMSGHVTITELGIAIMLGAIVAPPMETPERGILQGVAILFLVLVMHRETALWSVLSPRAEKIIQGSLDICVKDGVLQLRELRKTRVSRAQLFAILRMNEIYNLGEVDRLYMEASGTFSIFKAENPKPGLSLLPPDDDRVHEIQQHEDEDLKACTSCGCTVRRHRGRGQSQHDPCRQCGSDHWDTAVR
jgi:uncharacterized membrane protein YcaP (DUF421 family)